MAFQPLADLKKAIKGIQKQLTKGISKRDRQNLGKNVVALMKENIRRGISPITGRRFKGYKASYRDQIKGKLTFRVINGKVVPIVLDPRFKYDPVSGKVVRKRGRGKRDSTPSQKRLQKEHDALFGRKKVRPVNLKLTGEFLSDLKANVFGKIVEVGYFSPLSAAKEEGHRTGANGQRKRPTIPVGRERFSQAITDEIVTAFEKGFAKSLGKL